MFNLLGKSSCVIHDDKRKKSRLYATTELELWPTLIIATRLMGDKLKIKSILHQALKYFITFFDLKQRPKNEGLKKKETNNKTITKTL